MPPAPPSRAKLQRAVDRANEAIRALVPPGGRVRAEDLPTYHALVDAYMAAVAARDAARGREPEDDPAPVLVAA